MQNLHPGIPELILEYTHTQNFCGQVDPATFEEQALLAPLVKGISPEMFCNHVFGKLEKEKKRNIHENNYRALLEFCYDPEVPHVKSTKFRYSKLEIESTKAHIAALLNFKPQNAIQAKNLVHAYENLRNYFKIQTRIFHKSEFQELLETTSIASLYQTSTPVGGFSMIEDSRISLTRCVQEYHVVCGINSIRPLNPGVVFVIIKDASGYCYFNVKMINRKLIIKDETYIGSYPPDYDQLNRHKRLIHVMIEIMQKNKEVDDIEVHGSLNYARNFVLAGFNLGNHDNEFHMSRSLLTTVPVRLYNEEERRTWDEISLTNKILYSTGGFISEEPCRQNNVVTEVAERAVTGIAERIARNITHRFSFSRST